MNLHLVTAWKVYLIGNGVRATEFIGVTASLSKKRACIKSVNAAPDAHKNISQIVSTSVKGIDTVDFNVEQHEARRNFFLSTHFYEGKFFMGALIFTWNELTSLTFLGSLAMQPLTFSFSLSIPFFLALSLSSLFHLVHPTLFVVFRIISFYRSTKRLETFIKSVKFRKRIYSYVRHWFGCEHTIFGHKKTTTTTTEKFVFTLFILMDWLRILVGITSPNSMKYYRIRLIGWVN